jgi:hypothetical protein
VLFLIKKFQEILLLKNNNKNITNNNKKNFNIDGDEIKKNDSVLFEKENFEIFEDFDEKKNKDVYIKFAKEKTIYKTIPLLLKRSLLNMKRQPIIMLTKISQGVAFALILCCFYAPLKSNQISIQNRIGILFQMTLICFIGMVNCIAIFPVERNVFYREYIDGGYSVLAFLLSYYILLFPLLLLTSILIGILLSYAVGLKSSVDGFFLFSFVAFCYLFVGECIGVMFCAIFDDVGVSVNFMGATISTFCKFFFLIFF